MQESNTHPTTTPPREKQNQEPEIDAFSARLIRRKARYLATWAGFTSSDRADLEQEMRLKLLKQLKSFDPAQGDRRAFVATVIERFSVNILRDQIAEKRDHRRASSLNVSVESEDNGPVELAQTIGDHEANARLCLAPRSDSEKAELAMDIAEVVARLPDDLQDLCQRLQRDSISQVARDLDMPRSTLYASVYELRRRFEEAAMRRHL